MRLSHSQTTPTFAYYKKGAPVSPDNIEPVMHGWTLSEQSLWPHQILLLHLIPHIKAMSVLKASRPKYAGRTLASINQCLNMVRRKI